MNFKKLNRTIHYWGALACAIPIVIVTGMLLLVKKEFNWIQPSTTRGQAKIPTLSFDKIIPALQEVKEVNITSWTQIKRIDVRPSKGIFKIQIEGSWEIQMDHQSGKVLQVAW